MTATASAADARRQYRGAVPALIPPTAGLHEQWLEAHHEWGPGAHEDGFGLDPSDEVESPTGFGTWVAGLHQQSDPSLVRRATCRWIVEDDRVLGGIALRHGMNEVIGRLGHIGYGVRPSARGRGVGTWALGEMLRLAAGDGMDRVLLVCESDNVASIRTVERNGGVAEPQSIDNPGVVRLWIPLASSV